VDQLLADLQAAEDVAAGDDLKHDPPEFILSTVPAMLITIDGEPVFKEIDGSLY
jgi:hypothetical protein